MLEFLLPSMTRCLVGTNFPTFCSSAYVANVSDRLKNQKPSKVWLLVSGAFLYASMDEICRIHERLPKWQYYYVLPLLLVFSIGGKFLWNRLRDVPKGRLLIISGAVCYFLSLLLELYAQIPELRAFIDQSGFVRKWNPVEYSEEMLELFGTAFIASALLNYIRYSWNLVPEQASRAAVQVANQTTVQEIAEPAIG